MHRATGIIFGSSNIFVIQEFKPAFDWLADPWSDNWRDVSGRYVPHRIFQRVEMMKVCSSGLATWYSALKELTMRTNHQDLEFHILRETSTNQNLILMISKEWWALLQKTGFQIVWTVKKASQSTSFCEQSQLHNSKQYLYLLGYPWAEQNREDRVISSNKATNGIFTPGCRKARCF